jgi:very-short-patch-repair endonuclease
VPDLDRTVSRIARTQYGAFSYPQVLEAGGTKQQIVRRLRNGDWISLDRRVYALSAAPPSWRRQVMAAVLSKNRALVTGPTAGVLHGVAGCRPGRVEITVPYSGSTASKLAVVRRRSDFTAITRVWIDRLPVASAAETLFDLARTLTPSDLEGTFDDCLVRGLVSVDSLEAVLERTNGSRLKGTRSFREAMSGLTDAYVPTESELERMLMRALDDGRIPPLERQARLSWWPILPHRIDAVIHAWRLILEADGRPYHTKRSDFERDRRRDNLAAAHGYRVMRFTHRMLSDDPDEVRRLVIEAGSSVARV